MRVLVRIAPLFGEAIEGLLRKIHSSVNFVLDIQCPTLELIKRLAGRGKTGRRMQYDLETSTIVHRLP